MALTGELSDLSLAELIEFFCNQRKTGRLKLIYPVGPGYFYLQSGSVVHARIGVLRGIEAVYYALTLPNASFSFSPAFDAPEQTINQPWTSVVLEGLRRMDEGTKPANPFPPESATHEEAKPVEAEEKDSVVLEKSEFLPAPRSSSTPDTKEGEEVLAYTVSAAQRRSRPWSLGVVAGAVLLIIGVVGLPWGWYARSKAAKIARQETIVAPQNSAPSASPAPTTQPVADSDVTSESGTGESVTSEPVASSETPDLAAKRMREARAKERTKAQEASRQAAANGPVVKSQSPSNAGARRVTVQVTYDENGRVTQASGGDPTALRIARQKRFPAGKAGSATITIPIN